MRVSVSARDLRRLVALVMLTLQKETAERKGKITDAFEIKKNLGQKGKLTCDNL